MFCSRLLKEVCGGRLCGLVIWGVWINCLRLFPSTFAVRTLDLVFTNRRRLLNCGHIHHRRKMVFRPPLTPISTLSQRFDRFGPTIFQNEMGNSYG